MNPHPSRCLSVVMPCFNEAQTIKLVVERVLESPFTHEVIVVDDGSTDGSTEVLDGISDRRARLISHRCKHRKGTSETVVARRHPEACTG